MAKMYELTHQTLTDLLDYDPASGVFVWKVARSNRVKIGSRAGVFHKPSGGRYISIGAEKFMSHRLAFFYVNKRWPESDVRPVDGNYDNAAIKNLKEVSRVELAHQRGNVATNTSGYAGVSRAKYGKFQAKITWDYQQINLGASFDTAEDASEMYNEALRRLKLSFETGETRDAVLGELYQWRRQLTAWKLLGRSYPSHGWDTFEHFCSTVADFPKVRRSMAPVDAAIQIGPNNWKWSLPIDAEISTKDGIVAYKRANRQANADVYRDRDFRKKYGIDFAEYQRMLLAQNGVCAICNKPETKLQDGAIRMLSVDHNHATSAVRGLLCGNCNLAIGYACDDVTTLQKAIDYLERHDGVEPSQMDRDFADAMKRSPHRDWLPVATLGFGA